MVLDSSGLSFVDATGFAAIVACERALSAPLVRRRLSPMVMRALDALASSGCSHPKPSTIAHGMDGTTG